MAKPFQLDKYLARIGLRGALEPDLASLRAIQAAHAQHIPFEGLDRLLRLPIKLDLDSIQEKLVDGRRGGNCFEQNTLLKAALAAIDFRVTGIAGRVRWQSPPESPYGPREHMMLLVELDEGPYLVDVGFGACVIDAPLAIKTGAVQRTPMGTFRFSEERDHFALNTRLADGWRTMYVFRLEAQLDADYEMANAYAPLNPRLPFLTNLIVECVGGGVRNKLINRHFRAEAGDGEVIETRVIGSAEEMRDILENRFNLVSPVPIEDILARIPA